MNAVQLNREYDVWLQDPREFYDLIAGRDKPEQLRYVGALSGARARKANSPAPIPKGEDIYMSLAPFEKAGKTTRNIKEVNLLWCDLDFEDIYEMLESGAEYKLRDMKQPPNIIVSSGRGLWGLWYIEPLDQKTWREEELKLLRQIEKLGLKPDFKVSNPLKYVRMPSSINSKSGQKVCYKILHDNVITVGVHSLSSNTERKWTGLSSNTEGNQQDRMGLVEDIKVIKKKNSNVSRLLNRYSLNDSRVKDLNYLLVNGYIGKGNRNEYLHIWVNQYMQLKPEMDMQGLMEMAGTLNHHLNLPESEIRGICRSAMVHRYKYTNKTIIEKLGIDEEIQKHMEILIGPKEKARRDKERKRRSRSGGSMEEYKENIQKSKKDFLKKLAEKIASLKNPTNKELASMLNVSTKTIQRYRKQYNL